MAATGGSDVLACADVSLDEQFRTFRSILVPLPTGSVSTRRNAGNCAPNVTESHPKILNLHQYYSEILISHLLAPWSRVLLEKLTDSL